MSNYINKYVVLVMLREAIKDCFLISNRQTKKRCTTNKFTCGKSGCTYYLREINACVGVKENERCKNCIVNFMGLREYCKELERRRSGKK